MFLNSRRKEANQKDQSCSSEFRDGETVKPWSSDTGTEFSQNQRIAVHHHPWSFVVSQVTRCALGGMNNDDDSVTEHLSRLCVARCQQNHIGDCLRMRNGRGMAGCHLTSSSVHSVCQEAFFLWLNGAIIA